MIDLRSDTVTKPTPAMREKIFTADVGDDVYGEDPTVVHLEEMTAAMLGKEAAIFVSSGTQANLLALLTHCDRGDEYIAGQYAHTYKYEAGGGAVLGSIQPQPVPFEKDGTIDLEAAARFIKPGDDFHFARTKLFCLENTSAGLALPITYLEAAAQFVRDKGLRSHLDGARIFNAALKEGGDIRRIAGLFDTVSVCYSKGLGAPVGSALCGPADQIAAARRWRKMLGGGMRQAGVLAVACIHALENHVDRLAEDHENARLLAEGLSEIDGLTVTYDAAQTNMVFVGLSDGWSELAAFLYEQGIIIIPEPELRLVTHLNVETNDIKKTVAAFKKYFR